MSHSNVQRKIADLIPYVNNARTHSEQQVTQVAASIREFGFTNPILIDDNNSIIAGHGRLLAAKKLELDEVPCIVLKGLTEAQKKAYVIADNQLALNAGWDVDLLKLEIEGLEELDFDLDLLGFDDDFLSGLLEEEPSEGLTDEDEVPEAPESPVTVLGDVWLLGEHRLLCGDSTSIDAVDKLMDGQKAGFCFTSPPYNAAMTCAQMHSKAPKAGKGGLYTGGYSDDRTSLEYIQFNTDVFTALDIVASENFTLCYNINYNKNSPSEYIKIISEANKIFKLVETIVWEKAMAVSLQGDNLTRIYEFIFVLSKGDFKINKARTECLKNLWKIGNIGANHKDHKACFPVELAEEGIKKFSKKDALVIEPFGGSGSTLIACEKTGRHCRLMELDPKYIDIIINRWQDYTGQQAIHEETGKTYSELAEVHNG